MRTYQVRTSNFEVYAPWHINVGSVYAHKKLQTKNSEYDEDNNTMSKNIEELEGIVNPQKILIEEITIELGNSQKMVTMESCADEIKNK